jgi:hypothetical protein
MAKRKKTKVVPIAKAVRETNELVVGYEIVALEGGETNERSS